MATFGTNCPRKDRKLLVRCSTKVKENTQNAMFQNFFLQHLLLERISAVEYNAKIKNQVHPVQVYVFAFLY